jgi:signal transduction histidine kinase
MILLDAMCHLEMSGMNNHLFNTIRYRMPKNFLIKEEDWLPVSEELSLPDLMSYVDWQKDDFELLRRIQPEVEENIDSIIGVFYERVLNNPVALSVLDKAGSTVESLRASLAIWVKDVFKSTIDETTFEDQSRLGRRHVQVNLPQPFMVLGVNVIRDQLKQIVQDKYPEDQDLRIRTIRALNNNLDIRLAIMLRSYQDDRDRLLKENVLSENESILALGRMSASIAHEIKNPLAGISGAIQVLKDKLTDDKENGPIMESVLEQVHRMSGTVKDLLDFARPVQLNLQKIGLSEIIDSVTTLLSSDPNYKMKFTFKDRHTEKLVIEVDPVRLQTVFYNLFVNANEACDASGLIQLSSKEEDNSDLIFFQDNGPGIPENWVDELFKPFSTNKTHGTGLGLAISAKIVESHGGEICYLKEETGACFCIRLPKEIEGNS